MPYLTPETLPLTDQCRRLLIPDSPEWLAIVSGALTELTLKWNWQEKGITVDEAIEACYAIVASYYNQPCQDPDACFTDEGTAIIRRVPGGLYEQLIGGEWVNPEGDYEIEPTPPRTEPSELDRLCLASKNAVNVLKQLYEEVTDEFDEFGAIGPVIAAMLAGIAALVAAFVSAAAAAFVVLGAAAVEDFFQLLAIVTFDLWNDEFEELLYCILLENAESEGDVVHFDFDAIVSALYDQVEGVDLDLQRKQLCLQVLYLLNIIMKPGLEWAGTTTAITDDDCSDCDFWCREFDFTVDNGGWSGSITGSTASYSSGVGWISSGVFSSGTQRYRSILIEIPFASREIIYAKVEYSASYGQLTLPNEATGLVSFNGFTNQVYRINTPSVPSNPILWEGSQSATSCRVQIMVGCRGGSVDPGGTGTITKITLKGRGEDPFSTGSECP
jgi:hypothetical protein